jgi:hypothetical protein
MAIPSWVNATNLIYLLIALVAFFIIYWIWKQLDSYTKSGITSTLKRFAVPIVLIILFFYFRKKWGTLAESSMANWNTATVVLVFLLLIWQAGVLFLVREKYHSTAAIADGDRMHGSCANYQHKGDYMILSIGSIDAPGFPWPYGDGTWVCPAEHFNKINEHLGAPTQIYIKTFLEKVDINDIPPYCKDFIMSTSGYNKNNIYYGELTEKEMMDEVKDDGQIKTKRDMELKLKDTNRMLNESRMMVKKNYQDLKRLFTDWDSIQKKMKGQSTINYSEQGGDMYG